MRFFHTKRNALDYIIRRRHRRRRKASLSKRERKRERECVRVTTKRKRETETKFKSSRGSVREVYAGGVVTLETHSNVTYDYDYHIYASGIDRVPAEKYRILREKDASDDSRWRYWWE